MRPQEPVLRDALPDAVLPQAEQSPAEQMLERKRHQLDLLMEHSPAVLYTLQIENDTVIPVLISDSIEQLLGVPVAEALKWPWWRDSVHPEDYARVMAEFTAGLTLGGSFTEYRVRHKNGSYRWIADRQRVIRRENGVLEVVGVWTETTQVRAATDALRAASARLRSATQAANIGLWDWNLETNEVLVSGAWKRHIGYTEEELDVTLDAWTSRLHPEGSAPTQAALHAYLAGVSREYSVEFRFRHRDGSYRWIHACGEVLRDNTGRPLRVVGCHVDITEQKTAHQRISDALNYNRMILETSPQGIITYAAQGECISANSAAASIVGATKEQLERQNFRQNATWQKYGLTEAAERALSSGVEQKAETDMVTSFGRHRWLSWRFVPFDYGGKEYLLAIFSDETDRRQLEEEVRQAQKMECIGQLAGGVAHDFNNLLTVIQGQASLLVESQLDSEQMEGTKEIYLAAERAVGLTRQLLTFSRRQVADMRTLDLNGVAEGILKMLRRLVPESIQLELQAGVIPSVIADAGMIEQVLMNLTVNARDAIGTTGRILISTGRVSGARNPEQPSAGPIDCVRLTISDTGSGIAPEHRAKIFEPFFTTKGVGKGTGLGLATVYGIARQHGGWVAFDTEVGRGTAFHVYLPAVAGAAENRKPAEPEAPRGRGETILLVEDEATVRNLTRCVLESSGYRVLVADSGPGALEQWRTRSAPVDLLVTDVVMPGGITGRELADTIKAGEPGARCLYMSGYPAEILGQEYRLRDGTNYLRKPFTPRALLVRVRECLTAGVTNTESHIPATKS